MKCVFLDLPIPALKSIQILRISEPHRNKLLPKLFQLNNHRPMKLSLSFLSIVVSTFIVSACGSSNRTVVKGGIATHEETKASKENLNPESITYREISNDSIVTTYRDDSVETKRADDPIDMALDESFYTISRDPKDGSKVLLGKHLRVSVITLAGTVPVQFDSEEEGTFKNGNWNDFIAGKEIEIVLTKLGQKQLKENAIKAVEAVVGATQKVLTETSPELAHLISIEAKNKSFKGMRIYRGTRSQLKVTEPSSAWSIKVKMRN